MPELPEVETVVRSLAPEILGAEIESFTLLHTPTLDTASLSPACLPGATICEVSRRGKLITLCCRQNERTVFFFVHLRMTGALLLDVPRSPHTRAILMLKKDGHQRSLIFEDIRTFGRIRIADPTNLTQWRFWQELGPEPLTLDQKSFAALLDKAKKSSIKTLLLDQKRIAGIGNIYADESLFRARIHPKTPCNKLPREKAAKLLAAIKGVLTEAIEACGTSFRNYQDAHGRAGAFQNQLQVYGREGETCLFCGTRLKATRVAGRKSVFCPSCQPL